MTQTGWRGPEPLKAPLGKFVNVVYYHSAFHCFLSLSQFQTPVAKTYGHIQNRLERTVRRRLVPGAMGQESHRTAGHAAFLVR